MSTSSAVALITNGVGDVGAGLLSIFTVVVALIVGVYLFRKGVKWLKSAGH